MGLIKKVTQRLFGHTTIDSLELNQGAWYIDDVAVTATATQLNNRGAYVPADLSVTAAKLGAVAGSGMLGGNGVALKFDPTKLKGIVRDGTGVGVDVVVTGMQVGDILADVQSFDSGYFGGIHVRTSEYVVGDGKLIKAAGTNETGNQLMILYGDMT